MFKLHSSKLWSKPTNQPANQQHTQPLTSGMCLWYLSSPNLGWTSLTSLMETSTLYTVSLSPSETVRAREAEVLACNHTPTHQWYPLMAWDAPRHITNLVPVRQAFRSCRSSLSSNETKMLFLLSPELRERLTKLCCNRRLAYLLIGRDAPRISITIHGYWVIHWHKQVQVLNSNFRYEKSFV